MTNHLLPPHTAGHSTGHTSTGHTSTGHGAPLPPPRPVAPTTWAAPGAPATAPTPSSTARTAAPRRSGRLAAGLGIIAVSVVGVVASVAAGGAGGAAPRVLVADATDDTGDDTGDTDDTDDTGEATPSTTGETTTPEISLPTQPAADTDADTDTPASVPPVVLPTDTAPPVTTTPPAAHSLASVAVGDCLLDGRFSGCERGAAVVTHVAADASECVAGETTVTVTESNAVPATVVVCTVPAHVDDRTLGQAFTLDETCVPATAEEMLELEVDALVCTGDSGLEYVLVKVAEGRMTTYLTDVLGAEFVGDFTTTEGQVCGGHYRIDGWDAFVFGYGPFVEYRQAGDSDGVRFARSLCAA